MFKIIWKDIPGFDTKEEDQELFYVAYSLTYGVAPW
jgi:hypothetical protein